MSKHILIYTDFPKYGIDVWNNTATRNLEKFYRISLVSSEKTRNTFYEFVTKLNPDLIIFSDKTPESNRFEKTKCILEGIPYISVAHLVPEKYVETCQEKCVVDCILAGAKDVIAVSHSTLKSLRQLGLSNDKGIVIYPCFENIFNYNHNRNNFYLRELLQIPKESTIFLTVARIDESKGYKLQLETINKLQEKDKKVFNNLHWVWVGDGEDYYQLYSILQDTGLNTNIHMLGQMPRHLMPDIYAAVDAFILPSYYEGTSIALLEAIAMNLPIAATEVDGVKEVLNSENALLLGDPNKKSIYTLLEYAYDLFSSKNALTKKFIKNIQKERNKYTEEVFAKNLLSVIENAGI